MQTFENNFNKTMEDILKKFLGLWRRVFGKVSKEIFEEIRLEVLEKIGGVAEEIWHR